MYFHVQMLNKGEGVGGEKKGNSDGCFAIKVADENVSEKTVQSPRRTTKTLIQEIGTQISSYILEQRNLEENFGHQGLKGENSPHGRNHRCK